VTWDDFERVLAFMIWTASWSADMRAFDQREMLQLQNEYLERWPR
jgi:hypothetical protein